MTVLANRLTDVFLFLLSLFCVCEQLKELTLGDRMVFDELVFGWRVAFSVNGGVDNRADRRLWTR